MSEYTDIIKILEEAIKIEEKYMKKALDNKPKNYSVFNYARDILTEVLNKITSEKQKSSTNVCANCGFLKKHHPVRRLLFPRNFICKEFKESEDKP